MKVILKTNVKSLGEKGQMVDVSDGYANNYLIAKGMAVVANASNINALSLEKAKEAKKLEVEKEKARDVACKIQEIILTFNMKTGKNNKLFGTITNQHIAKKLKEGYGLEVDKKRIVLKEPIATVGMYKVEVKLHHDISANLIVKVQQEAL